MTDTLNQELSKMDEALAVKTRLTMAEGLLRRVYAEYQTVSDALYNSQHEVTRLEGNINALLLELDQLKQINLELERRLEASAARNIASKKFALDVMATASLHFTNLSRIPRFIRRIFGADFNADQTNRPSSVQNHDRRGRSGGDGREDGAAIPGHLWARTAAYAGEGGDRLEPNQVHKRIHDAASEE